MQGKRRFFRWILMATAMQGLAAGVHAETTIRIVEPGARTILYGDTDILVDVFGNADVDHVLIFLNHFPQPVCRLTTAPYVCEFDAGGRYQGSNLRAVAVNSSGQVVGEDTLVTLGFPALRTVQYVLSVPVVAARSEDPAPQLVASDLVCSFGGCPSSSVHPR